MTYKTDSGRLFYGLKPLVSIDQLIGKEEDPTLAMAIFDCGGHPRSIEFAKKVFRELKAIASDFPNSICYKDLLSGLLKMLADKYISLSNDDLSTHIITPIILREKYSINTIVPGLEMKFVEAVQKGIYLNDLAGPSGVPKLSL
ncbi:hypothetical protein ROZALSC1DRAFT_31355, partial [Rozella allomycis CSF55]